MGGEVSPYWQRALARVWPCEWLRRRPNSFPDSCWYHELIQNPNLNLNPNPNPNLSRNPNASLTLNANLI